MERMQPEVLSSQSRPGRLALDLRVPESLACWPGHFPEQSIVPGVLQLQWAMEAIASWEGAPPRVSRIDALKFKSVLLPGQRAQLSVSRETNPDGYHFELRSEAVVFSTGRLVTEDTEC